jgi:CubicO group peptidase (beta-lactamase class C family)
MGEIIQMPMVQNRSSRQSLHGPASIMHNTLPLPCATPAEIGLCPARAAQLVSRLQADIDAGRLPGAVALIARHGKVGLFEALGQQDPQSGIPMARDSIFRIYSMSKPIVSVAALMLMESGHMLLADPVEKYLPGFANQQVGVELDGKLSLQPVGLPATVQDLLRHTAGMTYEYLPDAPVRRIYREHQLDRRLPGRTLAQYVATLATLPLMFQPGTVGEYSRATDVLGRLIEVWSGQSLGAFLTRHVLQPLGMPDTGFFVPAPEQHRLAEPFAIDPDGAPLIRMADVCHAPSMESGGGGLVGTAMDYARFLQCLLNKGQLDAVRLLGPRTVEFMTADHLGRIPARDSLLEAGEGFGLGFAVRLGLGVTPVPGSPGMYYWSGLAGTTFFVDPAQDLFAILMIQAPNQRSHYRQLFRAMVYACIVD